VSRKPSPRLQALARFAADQGVPVRQLPRRDIDKLSSGVRHQGVAAYAPPLELCGLGGIDLGSASLVMVLDGITDPQNFGATIRSAVAFQATAVLWGEHGAAPLSPATFRASAGAVEHATLCQVTSLRAAVGQLGAEGLVTVALDPGASHALTELDLSGPVAIVVGAEDTGVSRGVRRQCADRARLPMGDQIGSLNASVAAAVALYECWRQRHS